MIYKLVRILKTPAIRKQEILDTAMKLFYEKGYHNTSMNDIAKELNVVKGLCYRYFDSKQELFNTAMEQYVIECCEDFINLIHDKNKSFKERLDSISNVMLSKEDNSNYRNFYHKPGNEALHQQLTIKMCQYLIPHIRDEIVLLCENGELSIEHPEILTEFIMYGQIGLLGNGKESFEIRSGEIRKYIDILLGI